MEEQTPSKSKSTVFVGGISWKADEEGLREYFEQFGTVVECKIIFDRATNKSKGYGFLTFQSPEEAKRVKEAKDLSFLGKTMNVGEAYHKNRSDSGSLSHVVSPVQMPMDMVYTADFMAGQAAYPAYYYDQYGAQYQPYVPYVNMGYYSPNMVAGVPYYDPTAYAQMQTMAAVPYYSPERPLDHGMATMGAVPHMMLPPAQLTATAAQRQPAAAENSVVQKTLQKVQEEHLQPLESGQREEELSAGLEASMQALNMERQCRQEVGHQRSSSEGSRKRVLAHVGGRTCAPEEAVEPGSLAADRSIASAGPRAAQ